MPSRPDRTATHGLRPAEFTALLAFSMALAALGIDLMLPAFADIRADLGLATDSAATAGLVTTYLMGLALGQVVYGPLSDRFGRKPALYVGYVVYGLGALGAALAPSMGVLLIIRFVWGLGAAGPRVVTMAVIRDTYEGERMSRAISFVMATFLLVPVVAPSLGAAIVAAWSWRAVFAVCTVPPVVMSLWARRLPETLADEHRLELRFGRLARATHEVATHRQTMAYTLALTAVYGAFIFYLGTAENIFGGTFGVPDAFPVIFGGLASLMAVGMLTNARVVGGFGTRRVAHAVLMVFVATALGLLLLSLSSGGRPHLLAFLPFLGLLMAAQSFLMPNLNTIALQPMGHIAGTASSVIGAVQMAGGSLLATWLAGSFDGTVMPASTAFVGFGAAALLVVLWGERWRLFQPLSAPQSVSVGATDAAFEPH